MEHGGHGGSAAGPVVQTVLARYFEKRAVQDDVRALGSAHERGSRTHCLVGEVHPGTRGVNDDVRGEVKDIPGQVIAQLHGAGAG